MIRRKEDIVQELRRETGLPLADCKKAFNGTIAVLSRMLAAGDEVRIIGFARLSVKTIEPYTIMCTPFGETQAREVQVPEQKRLRVRTGAVLQRLIDGYEDPEKVFKTCFSEYTDDADFSDEEDLVEIEPEQDEVEDEDELWDESGYDDLIE